jgi:hypothetical protein
MIAYGKATIQMNLGKINGISDELNSRRKGNVPSFVTEAVFEAR